MGLQLCVCVFGDRAKRRSINTLTRTLLAYGASAEFYSLLFENSIRTIKSDQIYNLTLVNFQVSLQQNHVISYKKVHFHFSFYMSNWKSMHFYTNRVSSSGFSFTIQPNFVPLWYIFFYVKKSIKYIYKNK